MAQLSIQCSRCITGCNDAEWHWLKTGPSQTGQLPGRIKSELCDLSGLRIDLISRLLSLSRLYSGILHSLSLSLSALLRGYGTRAVLLSLPLFSVAHAHVLPRTTPGTAQFLLVFCRSKVCRISWARPFEACVVRAWVGGRVAGWIGRIGLTSCKNAIIGPLGFE